MSKPIDGGPAFPVFPDTGAGHAAAHKGLTVRDYFAAKAMQGYIVGTDRPNVGNIAEVAYRMADAMIIARRFAS